MKTKLFLLSVCLGSATGTPAKIYDFIINNEIATEKEIELVTCIAGYNVENLNAIIYARTAYHDPEQCLNCEPNNFIDINNDFTPDEETDEN